MYLTKSEGKGQSTPGKWRGFLEMNYLANIKGWYRFDLNSLKLNNILIENTFSNNIILQS